MKKLITLFALVLLTSCSKYKHWTYSGSINQSGTNAPDCKEFKNNFEHLKWERREEGIYVAKISKKFNRCSATLSQPANLDCDVRVHVNEDNIQIYSTIWDYEDNIKVFSDDVLKDCSLEIIFYKK